MKGIFSQRKVIYLLKIIPGKKWQKKPYWFMSKLLLKMKLEEVLQELEKLFTTWKIKESDWILVSQYAYRLLGYDVKIRKGHFNILIKRRKIPWKIKEGLEIHPPRGSKFRNDFQKFIVKTGFDFDINL